MKKPAKRIPAKKNYNYPLISLGILLFSWLPLLNVFVILPLSLYFGIKGMLRTRKNPGMYGGFWISLISIIIASALWVISATILILSMQGI